MNFAGWTQRHRSSLLFLIAVLVVGGVAEIRNLPVALFPYISFPRAVVSLDAGDRPADQMAIEVTTPVEEAVRACAACATCAPPPAAAARKSRSLSTGARTWRPRCRR